MHAYYGNWKSERHKCAACGWTGLGEKLVQGEVFRELYEADCPQCGGRITTIPFPTLAEARANWDEVSPDDKLGIERAEAHRDAFERRKLSRPDELPNLPGEDLIIVWDIESSKGGDTIIRFGNLVLWREPAFYEGYERFIEVVDILVHKYGKRLQDLVPTRMSELYLYGDRLSSPDAIKACRHQLWKQRNAD